MLRFMIGLALVLVAHGHEVAAKEAPFGHLDNMTKDNLRWARDKTELSFEFNRLRTILKDDEFETRLLEFVGTNVVRHYWCGAFLCERDYRRKHPPHRLLATAIWQQGLVFHKKQGGKPDSTERSFHELLAIEYAKMGFNGLASHHKASAEQLFKHHGAGGPATDSADQAIYDRIKSN